MADALDVPEDLRPLLAKHPGLDWGAIAWDAVRARAAQVERAEELAQRSRLGTRAAKRLARELRDP